MLAFAFRRRAALLASMTFRCCRDHSSWLFVGQALPECVLHDHLGATAIAHVPRVVAEAEFIDVLI
jgi:hypothetical protein